MGTRYDAIRKLAVLRGAWRKIRLNSLSSKSGDTRRAAELFEAEVDRNLNRIARQLRARNYEFSPQRGIPVPKGAGKQGHRPIIVAPVANRVVQRALLDVLQSQDPKVQIPAVRGILSTRTSVGGLPGRGVPHALALVEAAIQCGHRFYIRSDIRNFFTKIPRGGVVQFMRDAVADPYLVQLFEDALHVSLCNLEELGDLKQIFPLGEDGVAQGSSLSPLVGNICLREFDEVTNTDSSICIRYIDDFLILAKDEKGANAIFRIARKVLQKLGMDAYSPSEGTSKAAGGLCRKGFDFLGYRISPGSRVPSAIARTQVIRKVSEMLNESARRIDDVCKRRSPSIGRFSEARTISLVSDSIVGWGKAFAHATARDVFQHLDGQVRELVDKYRNRVSRTTAGASPEIRQMCLGIGLLGSIPVKDLPDV